MLEMDILRKIDILACFFERKVTRSRDIALISNRYHEHLTSLFRWFSFWPKTILAVTKIVQVKQDNI